nr:hypothetical protein CFP56_38581 [Quercus suber]
MLDVDYPDVRAVRNKFFRERTGSKFRPYSKTAIMQYDKNSEPLSKHWATLHTLFSLMSLITKNCWCPKYSNLDQKDLTPLAAQLTTSSARQIGACFVEMAFETSTTKNLFRCAVIST